MGLFSFFSRERREERALIGHYRKRLTGSPEDLAKNMLNAFRKHINLHPSFRSTSSFDRTDAYKAILSDFGFDDMESHEFATLLHGDYRLGDLAIILLSNDLDRWNSDRVKRGRSVVQIYEFFKANAPEEIGSHLTSSYSIYAGDRR